MSKVLIILFLLTNPKLQDDGQKMNIKGFLKLINFMEKTGNAFKNM